MSEDSGIDKSTVFQLKAFAETVRAGGYSEGAAAMGIADKYRIIRALERLDAHLAIDGMRDDLASSALAESANANQLLPAVTSFLAACADLERSINLVAMRPTSIRCVAYPVMVTNFLADAISNFESRQGPKCDVHLTELDASCRVSGSESILRPLLQRVADVVIGPSPNAEETEKADAAMAKRKIRRRALYRWCLVAAVGEYHELTLNPDPNVSPNEAPRIDVGALREFKLLTSPKGHLSRELLTSQETFEGEFDIELETGDTEARIALGRESERVPIVPSDAPIHFEERWLVVVSENPNEGMGILGGEHSVYWRDDIENPDVRTLLTMFLDDVDRAAEPIRGRPGGAIPKSGL